MGKNGRKRRVRRKDSIPLRLKIMGLLAVLVLGVGCPCVKSAVNASPGLRWWLFSNFGASKVCSEMLKRGAPLRMQEGGNVIGRFYPNKCTNEIHDEGIRNNPNKTGSMTLHFGGTGYAWTPIAGRMGFAMDASVDYEFDFEMGEDDVYVYAKNPLMVKGPDFRVASVENKVVNWGLQSPAGYMVNTFGNQIVKSQLASGFTVLHGDAGDDFTLGILRPPGKPKHPFEAGDGDKYSFANETAEIHAGQLDFIGPFEVADSDQALFFRIRLSGNPIDAVVVPRGTGDLWREQLQLGGAPGAPPSPPVAGFTVQPGSETRQKVKVPVGQYYLVIDNGAAFGQASPPWNPLGVVGGNLIVTSYVVELGDEDDDF
jgi:hypothetical protein